MAGGSCCAGAAKPGLGELPLELTGEKGETSKSQRQPGEPG